MIEIKCPRCEQYWYDDDATEDSGRVRLCSRCKDQLLIKRGPRIEIDIPFLIGAGMFLLFDLLMIAMMALIPRVFGKVMLGSGVVMLISGGVLFKMLQREAGFFAFASDIDWKVGRWALLLIISGFVCMGAWSALRVLVY
jgi:hypothetical protein